MLEFEKKLWDKGYFYVCGIDEAGRGPLAGPVVAAAFILTPQFPEFLLNADDSKKLSPKKREKIFSEIKKDHSLIWAYEVIDNKVIDKINIYQATKLAMQKSVKKLKIKPDYILIDAMKINSSIPFKPIIKGDAKSLSIAIASIIAKVIRDKIMINLSKKYPMYEWEKNKGYPTKRHIEMIKKYGISEYHRQTFSPIKNMKIKTNSLIGDNFDP